MPQLPIPHDWDGESWRCIRVEWPDSISYNALLMGFLSYLTRGRAYDGETGSVKDAQAVGWDIYQRNWDLLPCEGGSNPNVPDPGELPCDWGYLAISDCEDSEDDMSCVITDFRCQNGVFQMFRCGKWEDIPSCGGMNDGAAPPADDDQNILEPEDDQQAADWRCSKATTIVNALFSVAQASLDHRLAVAFVHAVEQQTGLNLSDWQLYNNQLLLFASSFVLADFEDLIREEDRSELICNLSKRLDGSNNDIGENQWDIVKNEVGAYYLNTADPIEFTFMTGSLLAIGLSTLRSLTRTGVLLTSGECCPEVVAPILPPDVTWAHSYDFKVGLHDWTVIQGAWEDGVGIVKPHAFAQRISAVSRAITSSQPTGKLTFVRLEFDEWPQTSSPAVTNWGYRHPNHLNTNPIFFGRPVISYETNEDTPQGESLEFVNAGSNQFDDPHLGQSILSRLVIAGTGQDPWPADEQFEE